MRISYILLIYLIVISAKLQAFEYSITAEPEVFKDELEAIQKCCGNDTYLPSESKTLPCKNAGSRSQSCLKEKVGQISSTSLESRGEKLLKELPPVGRQFLIERCGMTNLVFSSLKQLRAQKRF